MVRGCVNDRCCWMYVSFMWNGVRDDEMIGDKCMFGVCVGDSC